MFEWRLLSVCLLHIATDTDNTGEEAHAGFADFRFVATEDACPAPAME